MFLWKKEMSNIKKISIYRKNVKILNMTRKKFLKKVMISFFKFKEIILN